MRPKRKSSPLWNHFNQDKPDSKRARCVYCSQIIAISSSSIGSLRRHLNAKHPNVDITMQRRDSRSESDDEVDQKPDLQDLLQEEDTREVEQISTSETAETVKITASTSPLPVSTTKETSSIQNYVVVKKHLPITRKQRIDTQLVLMIANGYHPLRMVDEEEFRKFVRLLNPRYTLPTSKTLSESILVEVYNTKLKFVQNKIKEALSICITTDGWTSITGDGYIALTAHFIDKESKLCSLLLGCVEYQEKHTSKNLSSFIGKKFVEWDIQSRICAVVSDNARNILAAVRLGGWHSLLCFAHSVNLVVQNSLEFEGFRKTVNKVKEIFKYFNRSVQGSKTLQEVQAQMNLPKLKLKQDEATRWHSTYDMLQKIVTIKHGVIPTIALLRSDLSLSNEDWEIIEKAMSILNFFYEVTTDLDSEKYASASKVIVYCKLMINEIERVVQEKNKVIQTVLQNLKSELTLRFSDVEANMLLAEATILDPRFKSKGFRDSRNYEIALAALKLKIGNSVPYSNADSSAQVQHKQPSQSEASTSSCSIWSEFDADVAHLMPQDTTAAGIDEIEKFLQEPILMRKEDPLIWWKARKAVYPLLYSYILKRLNITATSVPSERVFSKAGAIFNERRTRLKSKKLSQVIFINCNN